MMRWMLIFLLGHLVATAIVYGDEPFEPSETQTHMASLNDTYRASRGLSPHKLDAELCRIAQSHAERMAASGRMFHGGQDQCVAYGYATVQAAMSAWRTSPAHCAWLLSRTDKSGWGSAVSVSGVRYWCAVFRSSAAAPQRGEANPVMKLRWWRRK